MILNIFQIYFKMSSQTEFNSYVKELRENNVTVFRKNYWIEQLSGFESEKYIFITLILL